MLALRCNNANSLGRLEDEVGRFFDGAFSGFPVFDRVPWFEPRVPPINIWEDENSVYAEADLPGMRLEDIEVLVQHDELTIKGERNSSIDEKHTYHRRERSAETFCRVFSLGVEVNSEAAEATLKDGVLRVTIPKAEQAKVRKVEVKSLTA